MFGPLGNFTELLKTAKNLQDNLGKLQEELSTRRFEACAGGEMVRAVVDGRGSLVDLRIDPKAVADVELLEDLVKAAICAAAAKAQDSANHDMTAMTGGLDLGMFGKMLGGGT